MYGKCNFYPKGGNMKRGWLLTVAVICVLFAGTQLEAQWLIYDASVLPAETGIGGDVLDITVVSDNSPGPGMVQEIIDDPDIGGNKLLKYLHPDGKTMFRHNFDAAYTDSNFTLIARIKAENDTTYDRAFDLNWRNGNAGTRDELRIWPADSTIELEKAEVDVKVNMDLYGWHTYRVAVNGDEATVYVDENPVAVINGVSTSSSSDRYVKIGDGSGDAIGGYLDWCVLDLSGAYAPGEGNAFPEALKVDGIAGPADQLLIYDASMLPADSDLGGNALDLTGVSDNSPGPGMVQEIIDDPDIVGNKLLKYLHPDGKTMFRHNFDEAYTDSNFTLIARVKGEVDTLYDRPFDLQWRNGSAGTREELRIWPADSTIELEKANISVPVNMDLYGWHTYRIAVSGDEATVYVDENPVAVVSGISGSSSSDKYVKIGDGSGEAIGGYLDWCVLDLSGAYAPGEGNELPLELFIDGANRVVPEWKIWDASVLPEATDDGVMLDLTSVSDNSPGPGLVAEIIDDPDIADNKLYKYLHPDGKTMHRHKFADDYADSNMTFIIRVKGEMDDAYKRAFDVQWRNGNAGTRDELRISPKDSTLELEKADVSIKLDVSFYEWHTFRIVITGDRATVYMDENAEPVLTGISASASSDKYIKIGDGSGDAIGGYVDWCALDLSGGYAPGEGLLLPDVLQIDTGPPPVIPHWLVYDAAVLPQQTTSGGDTLDLSSLSQDAPGATFVEAIEDDPDIEGNKLLKYLQTDGTRMYRYNMEDTFMDSSYTLMARIKGIAHPAYQRAFDLQWRNGNANSRDELRIWPADSTIELEKADIRVKVDLDLAKWHTYRVLVIGDSATVYIDERSTPYIAGITTETSSDNYIKIGDGSGDAIGGYLDWCILDLNGANGPGEGLDIPEGLYVDPYIAPIGPGWLVYDAGLLPTETEGAGGDSLDLHDLSQNSPGPDFVEEIMDDPDIDGNKVLKYLQPNGERMYRYYFPEGYNGKQYTMMARIKGEADTLFDRVFDLQWRNANVKSRDELRIWGETGLFELEKSSLDTLSGLNLYEWHTIRIAVDEKVATIYVDENPEPLMVGESGESNSDNYIKIGDGSGDAIGGYLDWCILELTGAFAPGEGTPLPEGLKVDGIDSRIAEEATEKPVTYELGQNYPNPFNPTTVIPFAIPESGHVTITVYNALGREVMRLADRQYDSGRHRVSFDAANVSSGLYFYRIKAGNFTKVKKMMLLK